MDKESVTEVQEISIENVQNRIFTIRGEKVMIDSDLAEIYGYTTKTFNQQWKRNMEKFEGDDFMFQLTNDEAEILRSQFVTSRCQDSSRSQFVTLNEDNTDNLRCKFCTSNGDSSRCKICTLDDDSSRSKILTLKTGRGSNIKYLPYAFTEQGIYMLMTVLKGDLAIKQSRALIRTFKQLKDYVVENQGLVGQREYLKLSMQTSENVKNIMELRENLTKVENKVAGVIDELGNVVTKSELSQVMLDFGSPAVKRAYLILNGQPVEADLAYKQIYSQATSTIYIIDNYIGLKTLVLLKDVNQGITATVFSDNVKHGLHLSEFKDFCKEYPNIKIDLKKTAGIFHDRFIILDYNTTSEKIYHCGASSKDAGNRVTTISELTETATYHPLVDKILQNPALQLV